jgi:peptide/nickel transport system permease protein
MVSGEFGGSSLVNGQPISNLVARQLPVTFLLAFYAIILSIFISVPLGILAASRWNRWQDYLIRIITIPGQAIPSFWIALLVLLGLVFTFQWSPPIIYSNPWVDPFNHFQIILLPVLLLAWEQSSQIARATRNYMLEVIHEDYIRSAYAKGLPHRIIYLRHALRNALVPTITVLGIQFGSLLGGTLILESIFGIPGIGRGIVQAAIVRDYPVIQTYGTILVFIMLFMNLIIDIIYRTIDPRISYSGHQILTKKDLDSKNRGETSYDR